MADPHWSVPHLRTTPLVLSHRDAPHFSLFPPPSLSGPTFLRLIVRVPHGSHRDKRSIRIKIVHALRGRKGAARIEEEGFEDRGNGWGRVCGIPPSGPTDRAWGLRDCSRQFLHGQEGELVTSFRQPEL